MIEVDESHWPLVVYRFAGAVTAREVDDYLAAGDRMMATGERCVCLVVTEDLKPMEFELMRRLAAWNKVNEARLRAQCVGIALVLHSPMVRGMLRAVLWMQPIPQPYAVFSSIEEAMGWVRDLVRRAGIEMRPSFAQGAAPALPCG